MITPLLLYRVALRLFERRDLALISAIVLALAPAHVILSRQALDYVCPLPFVLGWLWFRLDFAATKRPTSLVLGGLSLGVGCYSYIASWAMMPIYVALSVIVFWRVNGNPVRPLIASTIGFAAPLLLFIPWLWTHPEMMRETFDRYQMSDQDQVSMIQDPTQALRLDELAATVSSVLELLRPSFLFMIGGPSMTTSTGRAGVFLVALAVLLPLGVFALIRRPDPYGFHSLIILAVVLAPIPATLKGQPFMAQRIVFMFPFAALIAAYGLEWLWAQRARAARVAAGVLLAAIGLQFAVFYRDYFTHYKLRSAFYYDPAAFVDVAAYLIADDTAPLIYLSTELDDAGAKWRYYTTRDGRTERWRRRGSSSTTGCRSAPPIPAACWPFIRRPPRWRRSSRAAYGRLKRSSATSIIGRPSPF